MRRLASTLLLLGLPAQAMAAQAVADTPLHLFRSVAISPDGARVAAIETDDVAADTMPPSHLLIHGLDGTAVTVALPCDGKPGCVPSSPVWSHDGSRLAFLVEEPGGSSDIMTVPSAGGAATRVLAFAGPLDALRYGPGDRLAVLATADAHKRVGRVQAGAALTGEIKMDQDEQRVAVVEGASLRFVSPGDLYVYEFDWRPDGGFVGTAAHGNGDANWWVAKLFAFDADGKARVLFGPGPREQLATPVVSPDGVTVAFVGGWMSDQGSTGGDVYSVRLDRAAAPVDLTPGAHATFASIDWHCGSGLTAVSIAGGRTEISTLAAGQAPRLVWSGDQVLTAGGWNASVSCSAHGTAAVSQTFAAAPEIVAGRIGAWVPITHVNAGQVAPGTARSITWRNDGQTVQGWLLEPKGAASGPRPMVVEVHGGPEAAAEQVFAPTRGVVRALLEQGWDVLEPNYRGSYGQGEAFAAGSIEDLGGGDWRDVLSGVDAAERVASIDEHRLGITGGSYGGYMTMWAVTQTHRFRAGVSDAGVSDWLSLEGEAPQAGSDQVNFGGSVYDNDTAYLKASPITHMKGVTTPVLIAVGERDLECPMPQSQEYYTAMTALGVPTSFVVYAGEGHALRQEKNRDDLKARTIGWFSRWFASPAR